MRPFALALAIFVLTGCSLGNLPTPRATYMPIPDAQLYSQIAKIPGVSSVDVHWTNGFDNPNGYGGEIRALQGADVVGILDRSLAILRQGHPGSSLAGIQVVPLDDFVIWPSDYGLSDPADYAVRYGPQPGTGIPPPTPLHRVR